MWINIGNYTNFASDTELIGVIKGQKNVSPREGRIAGAITACSSLVFPFVLQLYQCGIWTPN